ncbi:MAG: cobaltochelatase subunit CobN [Trichocoleus desertorum ATA4-8-CV12]|jgi:cobaltochelatase CobN|nr:cobaltochelatase subunit CobN [Trichocoleus desertorum ATA4-8-CV12]
MHRLAATPGGWNPQAEGVIFIEQTPAPLVLLTAADTDIQTIAQALPLLPVDFPAIRVVNLLQLQQQLTIDTYAEDVLESAQVIVLRLLGGRSYWSYGFEVVKDTVQRTQATLIVLPGDDRPDPDLVSHSTAPLTAVNQLWRYFTEGGITNMVNALKFAAQIGLNQDYTPAPPQPVPQIGLYPWHPHPSSTPHSSAGLFHLTSRNVEMRFNSLHCPLNPPILGDSVLGDVEQVPPKFGGLGGPGSEFFSSMKPLCAPKAGLLFYRAHYLAGNTAPIDALCQALAERGLAPVPIFVPSLRDPDLQIELLKYFQPPDTAPIQVLLNATSFSLAKLETETPNLELWQQLDVPVLQVILSGGTVEQWETEYRGLSPRDTAMNVALPEVDGRIISRAVSFKAVQIRNPDLQTDVVGYQPVRDRIEFVADLAAHWVALRQTPPAERRIALILANYPTRDGRLANGVGLDTPTSCVDILKALEQAGYQVTDLPQSSDELIQRLTAGVTNDPEGYELRSVQQSLALPEYEEYFAALPALVQQGMRDRWGAPAVTDSETNSENPNLPATGFPISGLQLGNVFVGIQPARGYDLDPTLNYHAPDLEPTHAYLAFYYWLRQHFQAQAIVHVGKHGNLEWLPGKSLALSENCYPEVAFGPLPHLYPFIVNDPGEGAQAKRRSQAVILDHLTPPMTRAELYGPLQQLERLIDEYYEAQSLDPTRLPVIRDRITHLVLQENLHQDLGIEFNSAQVQEQLAEFLTRADGYLCELKEAQIRDGLHIFGRCPEGRQLRDLIVAIARHPGSGHIGLTRALAKDWGLDLDPLMADLGSPFEWVAEIPALDHSPVDNSLLLSDLKQQLATCRTLGDVVELLEQQAAFLVEQMMAGLKSSGDRLPPHTQAEISWIEGVLLPKLRQTPQEINHLLRGLAGQYIPSGPSGAPTRGRPEVLPTGRNFYSVDIRAIPTESAWDVGRKAAAALIERYTQDNGEYPKTIGLSVWGTSTMRTGGDDIAEALALLGVQPIWEGPSRRMVDFEILPVSVLGRPRVDVTLRVSGFFRDAFANLIDLFDQAVTAVAALPEPPDQNPLAAQVQQETQRWQSAGLTPEQAEQRSRYRVFGSKPGAYGAGLQGLIEAQNWTDDQDLARAYINWSSYAYTRNGEGRAAPEAFEQRLQQMQVVLHNQDNREHDLLDSDDYYQFQGGLTAAVRSLTGKNPQTYFGDHSLPQNPKIRKLQEEVARVYRSRVVNPKWLEGVMRHGYKGAFEMAATLDYLFAYDATAHCVEDHMYQGVANAYLLDEKVQAFVQEKNPWALRDMAERLLEAHQRGLWQQVAPELLDQLRAIAHEAEAAIENTLSAPNS